MAENTENMTTVIRKNDPNFPEYFDFDILRKEGLNHIGNLSGKIWTDHNLHDPGITILETLCFALIDLGYRSRLPIEDLLTSKQDALEDNFFTPDQILTCNPLTIIDYRKMLIEIDGVRNVWLEVSEDEKFELSCTNSTKYFLNGVYKVLLELDSERIKEFKKTKSDDEIIKKIEAEAKKRLHAHRNLAEDFDCNIQILEPLPMAICGEIILTDDAQIADVFREIIYKIQQFFSPDVPFYTLQDLLEKGKPIEDIFAGRPLYEVSRGFIDTDELAEMKRHKTICLSDIYHIILAIKGVRAANDLKLCTCEGGEIGKDAWEFSLENTQVPTLSIDCLTLKFNKNGVKISPTLNEKEQWIGTSFHHRKAPLPKKYLDLTIPKGTNRSDLGDYYSIQYELPKIYGIGENELPDSASDARKAQTLQLQGYLLFYDQILADYAMQMTHLRTLFSMRADVNRKPEERHTYFTSNLSKIPKVEKLVRLYQQSYSDFGWNDGTTVALMVDRAAIEKALFDVAQSETKISKKMLSRFNQSYDFKTPKVRDNTAEQLRRDIDQDEAKIEIFEDECGFFFLIRFSSEDVLLISTEYFSTKKKASEVAYTVLVLATLSGNYREVNRQDTHEYFIYLIFRSHNYLDSLQEITESEATYNIRRESFLNHLLGRFQETFNDYALLAYTKKQALNSEAKNKFLHTQNEAKAKFLSKYDQISRNRGRAFDYLVDGWNSENVSGFEQRIASLANFNDYKRRNLCHFEVANCGDEFEVLVKNYAEENILKITQTFNSSEDAKVSLEKLLVATQKTENYVKEYDSNKNAYKIAVRTNEVEAFYPKIFLDENERDNKVVELQRIFRREATDEDIFVSKNAYILSLHQNEGSLYDISTPYQKEEQAWAKVSVFLAKQKTLTLHENPNKKHNYINVKPFKKDIFQLPITFKWHLKNNSLEETSSQEYLSKTEALDGFMDNLSTIASNLENEWFSQQSAVRWQLKNGKNLLLESTQLFADNRKAAIAFINAKKSNKYEVEVNTDGKLCVFWLNDTGVRVAKSPSFLEDEKVYLDQVREAFIKTKKVGTFSKNEQAFSFQIVDNKEVILLSYCLYPTKREALEALFQAVVLAKNIHSFYKSGDESNLNFSFQMRSDDGQFLAEHTQVYDNDDERNMALQTTLKFFKKYQFPLSIVQQEDRFSYAWKDENEQILLTASSYFLSPNEAESNFYSMLHLVAHEHNFEAAEKGFLVKNGYKTIAVCEATNADFYRNSNVLKEQQYFLKLEVRPTFWKFRYWQSKDTQLESIEEFDSVEKTKKAYQDFVNNLVNLKTNKLDIVSQKDKKVYAKIITQNEAIENINRIDKILSISNLYQNFPDKFIQKTPISQEGSFVFHVLKKDPSLAYHPHRFKSENEAKLSKICHQKFSHLEICLGGNVVIEKKYLIACQWITKYHFVIRERHTSKIIFVSFDHFDSYEAAAKEFEEQYLVLLRIALEKQYYGTLILKDFESHDYTKPRQCSERKPIAFLGDDTLAYDEYITKAAHYPIRLTGGKYRFQVIDSSTLKVVWRSTLSYDSPQAAMTAFKVFLEVLKYKCSCRLSYNHEHCSYRPVINEILLVSKKRFQEEKDAWVALEQMLKKACREDAFYSHENPLKSCCESFWLVDNDFVKSTENEVFDSEQACFERIKEKYNENFHVHKMGDCGPYVIQSWNEGKILAYHPQCYESGFEVKEAIKRTRAALNDEGMHLLEHILLRQKPDKKRDLQQFLTHAEIPKCQIETSLDCTCDDLVWVLDKNECGESRNISVAPCADPYSFWVTLVLPCWTCRFNDQQFRELFENLLHREAPAHIALNIRWVSAQQMCEFEGHYKQWIKTLKHKCEEPKTQNCLEDPCEFIGSLNEIKDCEANTQRPTDVDDCHCKEVKLVDDSKKDRFGFFNERQKINKDLIKNSPMITIKKESIKKLNTLIVEGQGRLDMTLQPLILGLSEENSKEGFAINEFILLGILDDLAYKNTEISKEDTVKLEVAMRSLNNKIDPCEVIKKWQPKKVKNYTNKLIINQLQRIILG